MYYGSYVLVVLYSHVGVVLVGTYYVVALGLLVGTSACTVGTPSTTVSTCTGTYT